MQQTTSLRTNMVLTATTTLLGFIRTLKTKLNPHTERIASALLKLSAQTKRLVAVAGEACLHALLTNTQCSGKVMGLAANLLLEKNMQAKVAAMQTIVIV